MNLTKIIDLKERIATSEAFTPEERDFMLECIVEAAKAAKLRAVLTELIASYVHARRLAGVEPDPGVLSRAREACSTQ